MLGQKFDKGPMHGFGLNQHRPAISLLFEPQGQTEVSPVCWPTLAKI